MRNFHLLTSSVNLGEKRPLSFRNILVFTENIWDEGIGACKYMYRYVPDVHVRMEYSSPDYPYLFCQCNKYNYILF